MDNLTRPRHSFSRVLLDVVFPRDRGLRRFDSLSVDVLARTCVTPIVERTLPVIAPLPFEHDLVRSVVHAAKYYGHERAALLLGAVLAPHLAEELAERRMFGAFHETLVVPMPLHRSREQERGFNQAERIAVAMIRYLADTGLTLAPDILSRVRRTAPQAHQTSRLKRSANVRGAFVVAERHKAEGKHILLIDDVVTTGATLHAAREALMLAGARDVLLVSAAHATS